MYYIKTTTITRHVIYHYHSCCYYSRYMVVTNSIDLVMCDTIFKFKPKKLGKIMTSFYKFWHVISGIDNGFFTFQSYKMKCMVNCVSLIKTVSICILVVVQMYYEENAMKFFRHVIHAVQHLLLIGVFISIKQEMTLSSCLTLFRDVDLNLKVDDSAAYNLETNHLLSVLLYLVARLIYTIIMCVNDLCLAGIWKNLFFFMVLSCRDIVIFTNLFIFNIIKCRLVRLIYLLKTSNDDVTVLHQIYKSICDIAIEMKHAYDPVFIVTVLINLLEGMWFIYSTISEMKLSGSSILDRVCMLCIAITKTIGFTFAPAVAAGLVSEVTEEIQIILHNKLLQEKDANKARNIEKFVGYVKARPLKFTVCEVLPLDARLPGMLVSLCTKYLIIVIQLSHLY